MAAKSLSQSCASYEIACGSLEGIHKVLDAIDHATAHKDWRTAQELCQAGRLMLVGACTCD